MPVVGNQFQDLYVEYLEQKSANFLSLDKIEVSVQYTNEFCLCQKSPNISMKFIVIVGNADMKNQEIVIIFLIYTLGKKYINSR